MIKMLLIKCHSDNQDNQDDDQVNMKVLPLLLPSLLPVTSIMLTASVYTVVCLSLERLLHLCRPNWSNKGAFIGYVLPVLVFSTCYNFPKFLEFTTIHRHIGPPIARATDFRKNSDYSLYVLRFLIKAYIAIFLSFFS